MLEHIYHSVGVTMLITEDDAEFFLKTIIPSRKMTKQYLGE